MTNEARAVDTALRPPPGAASHPTPDSAPPASSWDGTLPSPVEVTAPDRESATSLLGEAGTLFNGELVETPGPAVVVRLQPAETGSTRWVFDLLALIERWLDARHLPVANARYGGRSYLIPAPAPDRGHGSAGDPLSAA